MSDFATATERHLERLTTVPGLVSHLLLADWTEDEGLDLPAPEPQSDTHPDTDDGPWDLYAWLLGRLGRADGGEVWQAALRWYDAIMGGQAAPTPEPAPVRDPVTGIPAGAPIAVWSGVGERPIRATDWSTTEAGVLLRPVDLRPMFVPWTKVKVIEVGDD